MRPLLKFVALLGVALAIAWPSDRIGVADAQVQPEVIKSARGGLLAKTEKNQFEVFFYPTGLRLFVLDPAGIPGNVSGVTALATFYHPNSPKPWFTRPLHIESASADQPQPSLVLAIGLNMVPPNGARVTFEIAGLPAFGASTVAISVPVEFVATTSNLAPSAEAAAMNPRYVYGPGYYGLGYYQYPGPQAAPAVTSAPTVFSYTTPGGQGFGGNPGSTHDRATGRDYQSGGLISKPWLRSMD